MLTSACKCMSKFLFCTELYEAVQQKSAQAKEVLWVSSVHLGAGAHKIFSQEIMKNPPSDIRFVFPLNDITVKRGEINPYEIQYLKEHFSDNSVKSNDRTYSNIYIFDNSALITSANLTARAFENNNETGVMLDDSEVEKVKTFFNENLWQNAKPVSDLKKQKKLWNISQKTAAKNVDTARKKTKSHTTLIDWTDENVSTWYIGVLNRLPAKTMQKIRKETNWGTELLLVGDVGYKSFKELKLGDLTYLADLTRTRRKIQMQLARVHDKSRVETDEGDLHLACQVQKNFALERQKFYETLRNIGINSRSSEMKLNNEQLQSLSSILSAIKPERKKRRKKGKINLPSTLTAATGDKN
jgi:hypothetical protein